MFFKVCKAILAVFLLGLMIENFSSARNLSLGNIGLYTYTYDPVCKDANITSYIQTHMICGLQQKIFNGGCQYYYYGMMDSPNNPWWVHLSVFGIIVVSLNLMGIFLTSCLYREFYGFKKASHILTWYAFYTLVAGSSAYGYYNASTTEQCIGNDMSMYFTRSNFKYDLNVGCNLKIKSAEWAQMVTQDCSNVNWDGNELYVPIYVPILAATNIVKSININLETMKTSCIIFGVSFIVSLILHGLDICCEKRKKRIENRHPLYQYQPFVPDAYVSDIVPPPAYGV